MLRERTLSTSGPKPLKVNVSRYSGHEKEHLPKWILEVEMALEAGQLRDPTQQVAFTLSHLTGRARSWAFSKAMMNANVFPTFAVLTRELLAAFQPPKNEFRARQEFLAIKQGKRSLYDYIQEVRMLVSDVVTCPIDEATQVSVFIGGLRPGPVRTQLFRAYPETLESAINTALQEDFSNRQSDLNVSKNRHVDSHRYVQDQNGPEPMEICAVQSSTRSNSSRQVRCYGCGRVGHIRRDCRSSRPSQTSRQSNAVRPYARRTEQPKNGDRQ
jgi:hypothetical protein